VSPSSSQAQHFEFATASRVIFGRGVVREAGLLARDLGNRALVVTGRSHLSRAEPLLTALASQDVPDVTFAAPFEPTTDLVQEGTRRARQTDCDLIIGMGGGSVLDTGKAIAALVANGGDPLDYLEVIGHGQPLRVPSLPYIAIPTTAGTGAEVTRNAVLASPEHGVKASLRSPFLLPRVALVDPELTYSMPPEVTASTGLDALTQLVEPYVTPRANPLTDAVCREGMARAARSLRRAYAQGDDEAAREDMALGSLLGGLALANAGLGTAHGFASVLGGTYPAPHGAVCAVLLPHVMAGNLRALRERQPGSLALARYAEIARILTGNEAATAEDGTRWVQMLCTDLRIPSLAAYGVTRADFPAIVAKTAVASSTKANPIALTAEELREVLERSL
jgi:alcohol dehydrogenase class IV